MFTNYNLLCYDNQVDCANLTFETEKLDILQTKKNKKKEKKQLPGDVEGIKNPEIAWKKQTKKVLETFRQFLFLTNKSYANNVVFYEKRFCVVYYLNESCVSWKQIRERVQGRMERMLWPWKEINEIVRSVLMISFFVAKNAIEWN